MTYKSKSKKHEGKQIEAIISDACGILFSIGQARKLYFDLMDLGKELNMSYEDYDKSFKVFEKRAQTEPNYEISDAYRDYFKSLNREDLYDKYNQFKQEKMKLDILPQVKSTLAQLKSKGVKYILASDSYKSSSFLKDRLKDMGLNELIYDAYSSKTIGETKPSQKFFDTILNDLELKKGKVAFLGHDVDELEGAHKLGYKTIALHYTPKDEPKIGYAKKIKNFSDLTKVVEKYK